METRSFAKLIFVLIALLMTLSILSSNDPCDPTPPGPNPTGGWHKSPEDSVVQELLHEFEQKFDVEHVQIKFFQGDLEEFIDGLKAIDKAEGHLDFIGFFSDGLDTLISEDLIKPYPSKIDETVFTAEAIRAMKHNNILYGVPIYILQDKRVVKGVGVSSRMEGELDEVIMNLTKFLTSFENIKRIANAAGGIPARIQ